MADKRAHHNALERRRRDHIKNSFTLLRDTIPSIQNSKASRAVILQSAAEYVTQTINESLVVDATIDEYKQRIRMNYANIQKTESIIRRMEKEIERLDYLAAKRASGSSKGRRKKHSKKRKEKLDS